MKRLFVWLAVLLLITWLIILIVKDPGYVLISRQPLAVELPLWLALLGNLTAFLLFYWLIKSLRFFVQLPKRWRTWKIQRDQKNKTALEHQQLLTLFYQTPLNNQAVLQQLTKLEKNNWLSTEQIELIKERCYESLIEHSLSVNDEPFEQQWQPMSPRIKKKPRFIRLKILSLMQQHQADKAAILTQKTLNRHWEKKLVELYGHINSTHPEQQLKQAEGWLKKHEHDPDLLLCLGRLCIKLQLWGKAKNYLESGLVYDETNSAIYQELGKLFESLGQPTQALQAFKKAAAIQSSPFNQKSIEKTGITIR